MFRRLRGLSSYFSNTGTKVNSGWSATRKFSAIGTQNMYGGAVIGMGVTDWVRFLAKDACRLLYVRKYTVNAGGGGTDGDCCCCCCRCCCCCCGSVAAVASVVVVDATLPVGESLLWLLRTYRRRWYLHHLSSSSWVRSGVARFFVGAARRRSAASPWFFQKYCQRYWARSACSRCICAYTDSMKRISFHTSGIVVVAVDGGGRLIVLWGNTSPFFIIDDDATTIEGFVFTGTGSTGTVDDTDDDDNDDGWDMKLPMQVFSCNEFRYRKPQWFR